MKLKKTKLKEIILEVLAETGGLGAPPAADEEGAAPAGAAEARGLSAVKRVIDFMNKRVFSMPALASQLEIIKSNPTALAQFQANLNRMLGIEVEDVSSAATKTRIAQKRMG